MRLEDVILRDTRANQPNVNTVPVGTLYCVTDEGNILERNSGTTWESFSPSGVGDVVGPAASTDEALARFNGATGKILQNSNVTLSDAGAFTFPDDVRQTFNPGANNAGLNIGSHTTEPATPQNGDLFYDTTTGQFKAYVDGIWIVVGSGQGGQLDSSLIINGSFQVISRFSGGTLTTFSQLAARQFTADRWSITNETASVQVANATQTGTPEAGLDAANYGRLVKITNAGKACLSQPIESGLMVAVRDRTIRLQLKMKASGAMTIRVALLELQAAGTADTIPGFAIPGGPSGTFISAFNAGGTDPTFGTNLAKITPISAYNSTIANSGLSCSVTTAWQLFSGTFTIPTDSKNLVLVIFSDQQMAINDELDVSEVSLWPDTLLRLWKDILFTEAFWLCNRYYAKSFGAAVAPAQNAGLASAIRGHVSVAGAVANQPIGIRWPVVLRVGNPITTFYNPSAANAFARNTSVGADATATASANANGVGADCMFTGVAGWLAGAAMAVHYTAEAEL